MRQRLRALAPLLLALPIAGCGLTASASTLPPQLNVLLGTRDVARHTDTAPAGHAQAFKFTAGKNGLANTVHVYIGRANHARTLGVAIYTSSKGHPGALLTSAFLRRPKSGRWNSVRTAKIAMYRKRTYWIAMLPQGGALAARAKTTRACHNPSSAQARIAKFPKSWSKRRPHSSCVVSAFVTGSKFPVTKSPTTTTPPPTTTAPTTTTPVARTSKCFSAPGACGYPDPNYGNVGVPAGTTLSPSGDIVVTTPGTVINGLDVSGPAPIDIEANNVTVENSRLTVTGGGCGTQTTCGNWDVRIGEGFTGAVLSHLELTTDATSTVEHAIRNTSDASLRADHIYSHGPDAIMYGQGTLSDSYAIITLRIDSDHLEDIYCTDGTVTANHDTLLNTYNSVATLFCDTNGGRGGTCDNHITMTNNLLAGGGFIVYVCGNATSVGSGTMNISNNRIARCVTGPFTQASDGGFDCAGSKSTAAGSGADQFGYWPRGGHYGVDSYTYCPPVAGATWSKNVWDDNSASVSC
ncbi:MAG TPA: hypothetical protein VHW96_07835 [Solirubrobacteraceae bacterium]|jgi:hypothetical protein|nr:hypothetical protein [Solirubrobacteraceae bacterium]